MDQPPVMPEISVRERAAWCPARVRPAVLDRQIQTVGKTNFVLLCAALLRGTPDDRALMRLLPDTNADTSKRSIISTARRLVKDGHAQEVIAICLDSNLSAVVLAEARRVYDNLRRGGNR